MVRVPASCPFQIPCCTTFGSKKGLALRLENSTKISFRCRKHGLFPIYCIAKRSHFLKTYSKKKRIFVFPKNFRLECLYLYGICDSVHLGGERRHADGDAAVCDKHMTSNVGGVVAGQEQDDGGHLVWVSSALQRHIRLNPVLFHLNKVTENILQHTEWHETISPCVGYF